MNANTDLLRRIHEDVNGDKAWIWGNVATIHCIHLEKCPMKTIILYSKHFLGKVMFMCSGEIWW